MELRYLGYVGQNLTLGRTTGRTLRLANLTPERVRDVVADNLASLRAILEWNLEHGIGLFRMASSVIPFASHERFPIDWRAEFAPQLDELRAFVAAFDLRLATHPGQYTVLNSLHERVVANAVAELEYHAELLEALDPASGTMTLHVGGVQGDRERAIGAFLENLGRLSERARARLAIENDDRLFDVDDVLRISEAAGIPVVFDFFHHRCHHRRPTPEDDLPELLGRVVASWGGRVPGFHVSSPRAPGATSHADHVEPEDLAAAVDALRALPREGPYDVVLEAKEKDRAVLRHLPGA